MRPGKTASRDTWLKYYRRSAALYQEIAEIDRGQHHDAMYWATRERAKATNLQTEISKDSDAPVAKTMKPSCGDVQTGQ